MHTHATGWVQTVALAPPTLRDNAGDADRLAAALKSQLAADVLAIDLSLLQDLPARLRAADYRMRCVVCSDRGQWVLTHLAPAASPRPAAGLAVDLGTSRVALRLLDLATGTVLQESDFDNPQGALGPDILTRMHLAERGDGRQRLQRCIVDGLNREIQTCCSGAGIAARDIALLAVAGNTAMTHLLLGLDCRQLIREPYIPVVNRPGLLRAADLGLRVHSAARCLVLPNVGSYFGGDLIAGILFAGIDRQAEIALLVDVGTNAEVVVGNRDWLVACAGAAGPALEGGVTRMGMPAGPGAIDRVRIDPRTLALHLHTIGDQAPRGICGSGLIDLAAQLFLRGMIDRRGHWVPARCGQRLTVREEIGVLEVVPAGVSATGEPLRLSQTDLDSLIRSKAAMYAILETVTDAVGIAFGDIHRFFVAGTFGACIHPPSAIALGMLPDLPRERYQSLGNSSLGGATRVLTSRADWDRADRIRDRITYLELNVNQELLNRLNAARFLPHTDTARFPSVSPWP